MNKPRKVTVQVSRDEFHALLHRHADEDASKWCPGMQMLLTTEEASFIEDFRRRAEQPTCEKFVPVGRETR
jgi:hypothetical protein